MAANTTPIFVLTPHITWGTVTTANTATDGTGTVVGVFTAGANGSYLQFLNFKWQGTAVQTVVRVFINNGSSSATPANNTLFAEMTLTAVTASNTSAQPNVQLPMDIALPAGYVINITIGTTVANAIAVTAVGGDY